MTIVNDALGSLLGRVEQILPILRENAAQNEKDRWLNGATLDALQSAGVFRMWTPQRFGGLELSLAEQVQVTQRIATACPSAGWTCGLWAGGTFVASQFPESALTEIFAEPDTKASSVFAPSGKLVEVPGGYELSGAWKFNTGCRGAQWDGLVAVVEETGAVVYTVVPTSELDFVDDWYAFGAKGTGSSQTRASKVFVPHNRAVPLSDFVGNVRQEGNLTPASRSYGFGATIAVTTVGVFNGIARAAYNTMLDRLPGRAISYTPWTDQIQHPSTQVALSQAYCGLEAADGTVERITTQIQEAADAGRELSLAERAAIRGRIGFVVATCRQITESLYALAGASAIMEDIPIQRYFRDIEALSLHAVMNSQVNAELHGRVILGLDPATIFV